MTTPTPQDAFDPFDYVEPCEPDCTPERHAYHQGQWDMACRINEQAGFKPYPGAVEDNDRLAACVDTPLKDTDA